ncbi:MAG: hypothetical protein LBD77_05475 [Bifidobacteriaceae bacterium]|nr:hypothetical protein [Bifidobacteriaceae bacterium]
MSEAIDYKCPRCGGSLVYNAEAQAMVCVNCKSRFDPATFRAGPQAGGTQAPGAVGAAGGTGAAGAVGQNADAAGASLWPDDQFRQYTCPSCGATVVAEATAAAGACPYCRSPVVMESQVSGQIAPELVVPFRLTRDQAVDALNSLYRGKRLLPKVFARQNFVDEVKGVYVPFWLFDCQAQITERYDAADVTTTHIGSKRYVTTRRYAALRVGQAAFFGLPVDGSTNMPDAIMESIEPFDLTRAVPFRPSYLPGFLAERYDVGAEAASGRARERIVASAGTIFRDTVTGHQTVSPAGSSVAIKQLTPHYALLPVWMLTTIWRGQRFTFAMNGQTGRMVGDLPLDRQAYWRWLTLLAGGWAVLAGSIAALVVAR